MIRIRPVYIFGYRIHHGFSGFCIVCLGLAAMAHDMKDRHQWLPRRKGSKP